MPALQILTLEQRQIREECEARRLRWERRYSPPEGACPYNCDGSGWREVKDGDQEPHFMEVIHDGKLHTWCECNGRLALRGGHYVAVPMRPFQKKAA